MKSKAVQNPRPLRGPFRPLTPFLASFGRLCILIVDVLLEPPHQRWFDPSAPPWFCRLSSAFWIQFVDFFNVFSPGGLIAHCSSYSILHNPSCFPIWIEDSACTYPVEDLLAGFLKNVRMLCAGFMPHGPSWDRDWMWKSSSAGVPDRGDVYSVSVQTGPTSSRMDYHWSRFFICLIEFFHASDPRNQGIVYFTKAREIPKTARRWVIEAHNPRCQEFFRLFPRLSNSTLLPLR